MLYIRKVFDKFKKCENCEKESADNIYFILVLKAKDYLGMMKSIDLTRLCRDCLKNLRDMATKDIRKKEKE